MKDFCSGCKTFQEIVHTDAAERSFCQDCSTIQPLTSDEWALLLLMAPDSPFGPPFRPGDKVEARTVPGTEYEIFDGVGEVTAMSMNLEHGATPVYPTFRVVLSEKAHDNAPDESWYPECCLVRVDK